MVDISYFFLDCIAAVLVNHCYINVKLNGVVIALTMIFALLCTLASIILMIQWTSFP